jgi:hypothetical protein
VPLRARGNSRLTRQQRAEILEADRAGKQRENQRTDADRRISPSSTPTRNRHHSTHATGFTGNATGFFMD